MPEDVSPLDAALDRPSTTLHEVRADRDETVKEVRGWWWGW